MTSTTLIYKCAGSDKTLSSKSHITKLNCILSYPYQLLNFNQRWRCMLENNLDICIYLIEKASLFMKTKIYNVFFQHIYYHHQNYINMKILQELHEC